MSVYFVYRSHYETPTLNHLKKFDGNSVLEWFQQHWQQWSLHADDVNYDLKLFGCSVYGFASVFEAINQEALPPPKSMTELQNFLTDHLYVEGDMRFGPDDAIQVLTDDDELQLAYYFFDDNYVKAHPDKAAFLLQQDWKLPENFSSDSVQISEDCSAIYPVGGGAGTTYCVFLSYADSCNLDDLQGAYFIDGIRLPNLVKYLSETMPDAAKDSGVEWPFELRLIRSQLSENMEHPTSFDLEQALESVSLYPIAEIANGADWSSFGNGSIFQAKEELFSLSKIAGAVVTPEKAPPLIQVDEHVAQVSINTQTWGEAKLYQRWIFFDDLWGRKQRESGKQHFVLREEVGRVVVMISPYTMSNGGVAARIDPALWF